MPETVDNILSKHVIYLTCQQAALWEEALPSVHASTDGLPGPKRALLTQLNVLKGQVTLLHHLSSP